MITDNTTPTQESLAASGIHFNAKLSDNQLEAVANTLDSVIETVLSKGFCTINCKGLEFLK